MPLTPKVITSPFNSYQPLGLFTQIQSTLSPGQCIRILVGENDGIASSMCQVIQVPSGWCLGLSELVHERVLLITGNR